MKKNGFTFIEILGVITLLALLSIIILTVVDKNLKDSKDTLSEVQIENIKSAASMWRTDNIELVPEDGYYTLTLGELINLGYISDVIDPDSNENYNRNLIVKVNINSVLIDEESSIDDIIDSDVNSEIELIKSNINSGVIDGVYYYNVNGNLERNSSIVYLNRNWTRPRGNILIHNHQFISGCISIGPNNYDYYKGVVTKLNYSCSTNRGDNLFVNGDLSFGDNTNFSSFTYNSDGYLSYTGSDRTNNFSLSFFNDFYIPIDVNKKYNMGVTCKTNNTGTKVFTGFVSYDIDYKPIFSGNVMYINNTLTTLARDLKNGDRYVYLTDMTNWSTNTGDASYRRGFIFWNYVDSSGYHYPEFTYSQNVWRNLYSDSNIQVGVALDENDEVIEGQSGSVNRIKLNSAWSHGSIPAGTKLSQCNEGSILNYNLLSNGFFSSEFTNYTSLIDGVTGYSNEISKFRYGTRYIKWFVWPNHSGLADVTTDYKDFYLREVVE